MVTLFLKMENVRNIKMNLREARKASNYTQVQLANLLGCTPAHICGIENGQHKPSLNTAVRLTELLPDLNLKELVAGDNA